MPNEMERNETLGKYIGQCSCCFRIRDFLATEKNTWLKIMKESFPKVSPYPLQQSQINAWSDCYDVLHQSLRHLPKIFLDYHIIFEYVLPMWQPGTQRDGSDLGIRADALILGTKTVCVLEFKQRADYFIGNVRQAWKYRMRIQNYHKQSIGMTKRAVLILTKAEHVREIKRHVRICSPDELINVISGQFLDDTGCRTDAEIIKWLCSDFAVRSR